MMWTVTTLTLAFLFSALTAVTSTAADPEFLEPVVKRHVGVLPENVCTELIELGEAEGFLVDVESIDEDEDKEYQVSSQSIEIFERNDGISSPAIWEALKPWIPKLTDLVKKSIDKHTDGIYFPDKQPDRQPILGWVFFRKYSPQTDRKSLKLHVDSNMHTLNIALNHDYEGGGLVYVKPPSLQQEETYDHRPEIPSSYKTYDWLNDLKRENTSDVVFPDMKGGDVLIHNFTVWHGVAPVTRGARYSFVLFYDMDNPAIQQDFDKSSDVIEATFYHEIKDTTIDLVFVEGEKKYFMIEEDMPSHVKVEIDTFNGHVFRALKHGTDTVIAEFVMSFDQLFYEVKEKKSGGLDEL